MTALFTMLVPVAKMSPSAIPAPPAGVRAVLPKPARARRVVPPVGVRVLPAAVETPIWDEVCWIFGDPFTGHRPTAERALAGIVVRHRGARLVGGSW